MAPARNRFRSLAPLVLCLALAPIAADAGAVLTGSLGANSRDGFKGAGFAYSAAAYLKFDDMTLLGVQGGQGSVVGSSSVPVLGSALVRLPIGRIVLPVAIGDMGYVFADSGSGLLWRGGGGFDIRNGRHSSLLLLGAYEASGKLSGWMGRLGILLEF